VFCVIGVAERGSGIGVELVCELLLQTLDVHTVEARDAPEQTNMNTPTSSTNTWSGTSVQVTACTPPTIV
jgi:hypothetical protein